MRRLKALYFLPVALVLLIGAGFAFYYLLLKPRMEAVKEAQAAWVTARDATDKAKKDYQPSLQKQVSASQKIFDDYHRFHVIQEKMPLIFDLKDAPYDMIKATMQKVVNLKGADGLTQPDRKKLYYLYSIMGTGQMLKELYRWQSGFSLQAPENYSLGDDKNPPILGYETTFADAKLINVKFGKQTFTALGYADLLRQINQQTGYSYFPLIIDLGATISIKVDMQNPKHKKMVPALTLDYTPTGYFFTRGWDPMDDITKVQDTVKTAENTVLNPPKAEPKYLINGKQYPDEASYDATCPTILWYYKPVFK